MQICSVSPNKPLTFMLRSNMRNLTSYKPNNFVNCGIGRENETVQKKKKPITRFLSRRGVRMPLLWCTIHNLIRILTKSIGLGYFLLIKNQAQRRFMPQKAID